MAAFDSNDSLGSREPGEIADYLREIGDEEEAKHYLGGAGGQAAGVFDRPYARTGMVIGFIPPKSTTGQITGISSVQGDQSMIGKRIKITLDKFFVSKYPGLGQHSVLCEFTGKNQVPGETEELSFALRLETSDNASPAIAGAPIFMGIMVSQDGIAFKGRTVNVRSSMDDVIMATLDSPAFKSGLTLLHTAQPALKPLTSLATATVGAIMKRDKNRQVHSFDLGLDFGGSATSARLRHGSYVVVQTDEAGNWNWRDYEWNSDGMALHPVGQPRVTPDFNYMVFGVSPFSDGPATNGSPVA